MAFVKFPIFHWDGIVQPSLIEWQLPIIVASLTFRHFTPENIHKQTNNLSNQSDVLDLSLYSIHVRPSHSVRISLSQLKKY